jgi:hypothetical protein
MDLHCHCSIRIDAIAKSGCIEKGTNFGNTALAWISGLQARKIHVPAHVSPLCLIFFPKPIIVLNERSIPDMGRDHSFNPRLIRSEENFILNPNVPFVKGLSVR